MEGDAALEATYRFLNNEAVTPQAILNPHITATVARCVDERAILVAHDTTELRYSTSREGLGRLNDQGHGFFAHYALAMSADGRRRPLGVLGLETIIRAPKVAQKSGRRGDEGEGRRWGDLIHGVRARLGADVRAIHVMDREADSYPLFAKLIAAGEGFICRMKSDRFIETPQPGSLWISERLEAAEELFVREASISSRRRERVAKDRAAHPPRAARKVRLSVRAVKMDVKRPSDFRKSSREVPPTLALNVVHVHEVDTTEQPIDWKLMTTERIETLEDVSRIVDAYRARWMIEEFFKALKTGCAVEKRQLESSHALLNALAIFTPIAWHLLKLRQLARQDPDAPAETVLSPLQLRVLASYRNTKLAPNASAYDAMLTVAKLGGHIKNNGDPGWQVLGRGFDKLLLLEEGARAALEM